MDPDANLREQLELANAWVNADEGVEVDGADALRMAELVLALDEWIRGGGFLPEAWGHTAVQVHIKEGK